MGRLTFALNVTLDGCVDHRVGVVDDTMMREYTAMMDRAGAMLFGRTTYEMMEEAWPSVARDPRAPAAYRNWAKKLEAKRKYVVSSTRRDFPWKNTVHIEGKKLGEAITAIKRSTPRGILVGSPKLSKALEQLGLIDEYRIALHPVLTGHGPTLFSGLGGDLRTLQLIGTKRLKSGVLFLHYRK